MTARAVSTAHHAVSAPTPPAGTSGAGLEHGPPRGPHRGEDQVVPGLLEHPDAHPADPDRPVQPPPQLLQGLIERAGPSQDAPRLGGEARSVLALHGAMACPFRLGPR